MGERSSNQIEQQIINRLDQKMALGESRHAAKQAIRYLESRHWRIHSQSTRKLYQGHLLRFVRWCRRQGFDSLAQIENQSDELVSRYLAVRLLYAKAATVKSERSALRFFFENANLGASIVI